MKEKPDEEKQNNTKKGINCNGASKFLIQSIGLSAWNAIVKGSFISTKVVNGELVPKEWDEMKDDEERKVQDDQKAKNI